MRTIGVTILGFALCFAMAAQTANPASAPVKAGEPATRSMEVKAPGDSETLTATPTAKPVIESVFPTTTYPIQKRFNFEINGQNFDPEPKNDEVEVQGQGTITFGSRINSPEPKAPNEPAEASECAKDNPEKSPAKYPCLEVSRDGRRLRVYGFPPRHRYQGPMRVKVVVKGVASDFSPYFTLSRVDHRIIVWLTFLTFGMLMYIVYRLVTKGVQGYTVGGRKYSPIAAFLIDKTTDSYSLSKFQLFAFSMVAFFGYVYVFLCRALVQWNFTFPEIPDNYPSMLAISVGTTAAAVGLNSTRGTKGAGPVYPSAADFISDGGLVVPERFQFFVWTLIACIGFVGLILMQDPATVTGFPSFPTGLLYVMGVSAGGYLGGKAVRSPGPILKKVTVAAAANNIDLNVTLTGENLDKNGKFRIDGASQIPEGPPTGDQQPQAPDGYFTRLAFTLVQAAQFAQGDHTFEITNRDGVGAQSIFTNTPMRITNLDPLQIPHGQTTSVRLTVRNYREGSSARWLAPGATVAVEIPPADITKPDQQPAAADSRNVDVRVPAGDKAGTGTLTLVSLLGGTEVTSVTVT